MKEKQLKKAKTPKQRGGKGMSAISNGGKKAGKTIWVVLSWGIIGLVLFALLTGYINQRKTGQAILDFYIQKTHQVGDYFNRVANGESPTKDLGVKVTNDGVYVDK